MACRCIAKNKRKGLAVDQLVAILITQVLNLDGSEDKGCAHEEPAQTLVSELEVLMRIGLDGCDSYPKGCYTVGSDTAGIH
ncbi:hypothetical protein LB503_010108 [Fusarium chuoi]|nr:hypothetical protein LB503_010108 [Fusarium chuoi]